MDAIMSHTYERIPLSELMEKDLEFLRSRFKDINETLRILKKYKKYGLGNPVELEIRAERRDVVAVMYEKRKK